MQTRTITVDYDRPRGYELGYSGENNIVKLALPVPPELSNADGYRVYFETTTGESRQTDIVQAVEGAVTVTLTADLAPEPGTIVAQLVAFADGDIIGKAPVVYGTVKQAIADGSELDGHSLVAEVTANTLARHTHANKTVLDKLGEGGGNLTYDGNPISGGTATNELVVNVKLTDTDSIYPKATADKTYDELSAAYAAGTKISVRATADEDEITALLPLLSVDNSAFTFAVSLDPGTATVVMCTADGWSIDNLEVDAGNIVYGDTYLSLELNHLNNEVNANTANRHAHSNKAVLDSLSTADGKLKYNGEDVGLKGADGITYTPSVSSDGTLSWTNNGGRDNPPSVNIKGAKGDKGDKGDTGEKGDTGTKGDKGDKGETGATGAKGADGKSAYQTWLDAGNSGDEAKFLLSLKGDKGDSGAKGDPGTSGTNGKDGTDGKTPVKGTDYWTAADQAAIVADVLAALPDGDEVSY